MVIRRRLLGRDENDVHTGWRRYMTRYTRAGATTKVKCRTNRRERREGRAEVREQLKLDLKDDS